MLRKIYVMTCDYCGEEHAQSGVTLKNAIAAMKKSGCIVRPRQGERTFCDIHCQEEYRAERRKTRANTIYNGAKRRGDGMPAGFVFVSTHVKRTD